jgi:lactate dehydrogenase-like 2-hydroxyacid dehydrogenase
MKILFLERPYDIELFQNLNNQVECYGLDKSRYRPEDIDVIYSKFRFVLNDKSLREYKNLKYILAPMTGLGHIDEKYCKKHGIEIITPRNSEKLLKSISSTAEIVFILMIILRRPILKSIRSVSDGNWVRDDFFGKSLANVNLGIVGYGRLGKIISKIGIAFGMNIYVYEKKNISKAKSSKIVFVDKITDLFETCEIVSINVDDNPENSNLINNRVLQHIPNTGLYLINTSRGHVLNEKDVVRSLISGKLKGLGVDVLQSEHIYKNNFLKENLIYQTMKSKKYNICITPHIGGATTDSLIKIENYLVHQLKQQLKHTTYV